MLLTGQQKVVIADPRGAWTRTDQRRSDPRRATQAQNVRFGPLTGKTREGTISAGYSVGGRVTSAYHWVTSEATAGLINRLIYFEQSNAIKVRDLIGGGAATLFNQTCRGIRVAESGPRIYISCYDANGFGAAQVRIVNALLSGSPSDKAFAPPMTIAPIMTTTGAGQCTAGSHRFGYIMESRSGFTGKLGPAPSDVFTPVTYAVATGGKALRMEVTGMMPTDAAFLHPVMTRIDNLEQYYYVPGAALAVPAGASYTAYMTCDISDSDLARRATIATDNQNLLCQTVSGSGPFLPSVVVPLGRRMGYIVDNKLYVSDIDNPQALSADQHFIQIPGQKKIILAFALGAVIYMLGPAWTFAIVDNGDVPKLWGTPHAVSGKLGTTSIHGASIDAAGRYGFVINDAGLWHFEGDFGERPVSYMADPDWKKLNWAVPHAIQVVDVPKKQRVEVAGPLSPDTEPTSKLVFQYGKEASDPKFINSSNVDFSKDPYGFGGFGCLVVVLNPTTGENELWVMPASAANILKHSDTAVDDAGSAIASIWESGLALKVGAAGGDTTRFNAILLDLMGSGNLQVRITARGRKDGEWVDLDPIALETMSADDALQPFDLLANNVTVRLQTTGVGEWFDVAVVTLFHTPYLNYSGAQS
jgi:hypothetical protein